MNDSRNLMIGVLTTTATVLFTALIVIATRPETVLADGMTINNGDYTIAVGAVNQVDEEYVYLIDNPLQRMIVYRFDGNRQQIEVVSGVDLAVLREATRDPGKDVPPGKTQPRQP